ncbi:F-box/WD repeat-containing protein [Aspergillus saccharolyticus JOP 1030-1]|uniref:Probable E3 ubiquitin ligase complex SCF subunit sconB n=1 Tax=Aspergillus saccharolyticus JOP 1030-1 TaxID=1450539 RepID=A0A319AJR3_9EURO|nr:cell division control protein Cdc4 [Aspergillus saccharolyticus JOP 1030-1]PYH46882.1 cell division control protein Cdc4 [Aspergillus saccharolyticus JOP 1030-1]
MEDQENNHGLGPGSTEASVGQFSYPPTTQTTVVTTTTTTTTTFPPMIFRRSQATRKLDPKLYPLASSPTPSALRNIKFELGGKQVVFNEPEDTAAKLKELKEKAVALNASNGMVRSVTSFTSDEAQLARRSQPVNHLSISKRRDIENSHRLTHANSSRVPSESSIRSSRSQAPTPAHPMTAGLATPETESNNSAGEGVIPRRRVYNLSNSRRESLLRSPLSSELESQGTFPGNNAWREPSRTKTVVSDRSRPLVRHDTESSLSRPQLGAAASQDSGYGAPDDDSLQPPMESASQRVYIDNIMAQDMCLPSPSLSPVAAMNAMNVDSSFDSAEDPEVDTDSSFENNDTKAMSTMRNVQDKATYVEQPGEGSSGSVTQQSASLMEIPAILDYFEAIPDAMKTWVMYKLLTRCPKPTLQFVADVVNPALKCDFLSALPTELSLNIVKYFDVKTMCRAAQVSKRWRHIINSDEKSWKELFDRDGYKLPNGELERAIREGWGWQFPSGSEDHEKDLSALPTCQSDDESGHNHVTTSLAESSDRTSAFSRRPKRKAVTRVTSRKLTKRKISSSGTDYSEPADWRTEVSNSEGPYAAANAAAAAIPYPDIGLPTLRGLHLYKSLYQRHHAIHKAWMKSDVKPRHIAFGAHGNHVVTCLQFDTDKILTGSDDTNINVYDTKTGVQRATLEGHEGGVWALEYYGNTLVSGSTDRSVRVWDIEKAKCTQVFHGHTSTVRCLQIVLPTEVGKKADGSPEMMPKEPLIITGSRDSNLRIWKLPKPGDPEYHPSGPHSDDTDCPYFVRVLTGHQHSVRAIAAHGDTLVSGSYDFTVRVWKISTGETVHRLQGHTSKVYSVVIDQKRNRCISGAMDVMVKVWSLETGSLLFNLEGHSSLVGLLDLKYDRLVSAAADSTLRIWDPETGQCKNMLSAHTGAITCFQHDGQKVISGSDRTLKMWDIRTGECVRDLLTDLGGVWQVKFNDRRCVAAVQRNEVTYIEVLDFGASRDGVPSDQLGRRIVVNRWGNEIGDTDEDYDLSDV